jgi:pseudaminic acid synthase
MKINKRVVGPGTPTYIIAEMSANHNQDFEQAVRILGAAKEAGADAVKLQTYTPDTLTIDSDKEYFRIRETLWEGRNLYDLYSEAHTPWEWQPELKRIADGLGLDCFSSPFDATAVDFLEGMDVPAYKIASFEVLDLPLIRRVAQTRKPVIMSTGMASLAEIDEAVRAAREAGATEIALLKCNSAYPAPPEEMNLRTIPHLAEAFKVPVGLSDHTMGSVVAIAAVTLGARIVEKHFTLSRDLAGPDSAFSMEPHEFKEMVSAIRMVEKTLGEVSYQTTAKEEASKVFRRSLFVVKDVKEGDVFDENNVRVIRPAHGLAPKYLEEVLGRRAACDVERGTPLSWALLH